MNRLELVRRLRQEAGVGAGSAGTGPSSTINQTGEYKRLVDWVDGAWSEIQREHKWDFLWESATVTVLSGDHLVAGSIPAGRYVQSSAFVGAKPLEYMPWRRFSAAYPDALLTDGEPSAWSVRPDKALVVNYKPLDDTDIIVERYKNPIAMTADTDIPAMPVEHHMAIVWKALLLYSNFEEAGVTRLTAQTEYERHIKALGLLELPDFEFGDPLL